MKRDRRPRVIIGYRRTLKDVAAHGRRVTLRVQVSRWRCRNPRCTMTIFAERLLGVAAARVQQTTRFGVVVHFGRACLGWTRRGTLLARLQMAVSTDTVF